MLEGINDCLRPVMDFQLGQDVADMGFDGFEGDE